MLTDGHQTKNKGRYTPLDQAAQPLKDKGVEVWAVGIGKYFDRKELELFASDSNKVIEVSSFEKLNELWDAISEASCKQSKL